MGGDLDAPLPGIDHWATMLKNPSPWSHFPSPRRRALARGATSADPGDRLYTVSASPAHIARQRTTTRRFTRPGRSTSAYCRICRRAANRFHRSTRILQGRLRCRCWRSQKSLLSRPYLRRCRSPLMPASSAMAEIHGSGHGRRRHAGFNFAVSFRKHGRVPLPLIHPSKSEIKPAPSPARRPGRRRRTSWRARACRCASPGRAPR